MPSSFGPADDRRRRPIAALALALLVVANVALHLALLRAAPYLDEGCFASQGWWIRHGALFYRDAWNERGPLIYLISAALFSVAPYRLESVRILALLLSTAQLVLLFAVARRWIGGLWSLAAPAFYLVWHPFFLGTFYMGEQLDGTLILAAVLALSWESARAPTAGRAAVAGLALSLLGMDKQSGIALFVLLGAYAAWRATREGTGRRVILAYVLAALPPWLLLFSRYAAAGEVPLLVQGLLFPIREYQVARYARGIEPTVLRLAAPLFVVLVAEVARRAVRRPPWTGLFLLWLAGTLVLMGPNAFLYHFLALLLPASIAFAAFLAGAAARRRPAIPALALAALLGLSIAMVAESAQFVRNNLDPARWGEIEALAATIRARTAEGDPIWVFPHESTLYLFADRRSASRYPFLLPWTASPRVLAGVVRDLAAHPPRWIVYTDLSRRTTSGIPVRDYAAPVVKFVESRYAVAGMTRSGLVLLRRLPDGTTLSAEDARDVADVFAAPDHPVDLSRRFPLIGPAR